MSPKGSLYRMASPGMRSCWLCGSLERCSGTMSEDPHSHCLAAEDPFAGPGSSHLAGGPRRRRAGLSCVSFQYGESPGRNSSVCTRLSVDSLRLSRRVSDSEVTRCLGSTSGFLRHYRPQTCTLYQDSGYDPTCCTDPHSAPKASHKHFMWLDSVVVVL